MCEEVQHSEIPPFVYSCLNTRSLRNYTLPVVHAVMVVADQPIETYWSMSVLFGGKKNLTTSLYYTFHLRSG